MRLGSVMPGGAAPRAGRGWVIGLAGLLSLSACQPPPAGPQWSGYAEGDTTYLAAPVAGRVEVMAVQEGDAVQPGQLLFRLQGTLEHASQREAVAREAVAQAQAADADKGRRREELAVSRAQLQQARRQAELAQLDLQRQRELLDRQFVARSRVEDADLVLRQAQARVAELEAAVDVAHLPAREDERRAARASAEAASAVQAQSRWRLDETVQRAVLAGRVQTRFFLPGEWVNAGQPVLAVLPDGQRKARFFVPEADLGALKLQQAVLLRCDGCGPPMAARISFIADQAEYTPPVIYSNAQRAKLVFMVEARPEKAADALRLHPGQPLDVSPAPAATAP